MLSFKPPRRQGDGQHEAASRAAAITFDPTEDKTRQEDGPGTDINRIVKMFSPRGPQVLPAATVTDYDIDLQTALGAVRAAREAHGTLDEATREMYPTWQSLLTAIEQGVYETPDQRKAREEAAEAAIIAADEARYAAFLEKQKQNKYNPVAGQPKTEE